MPFTRHTVPSGCGKYAINTPGLIVGAVGRSSEFGSLSIPSEDLEYEIPVDSRFQVRSMTDSVTLAPPPPRSSATALAGTVVAVALAMGLVACASVPTDYDQPESRAYQDFQKTLLWHALAPTPEETVRGLSNFLVLDNGRDALFARLALIELAEHSIDAQYYEWHADATGVILGHALLEAADRGVRVRLLIDGLKLGAERSGLVVFDVHPNIELRIYNPPGATFRGGLTFLVDALSDFERLNRRMHNKAFLVDNAAAVMGGRNIGDEYFGASRELNYRDRDVLAVGTVVPEISVLFDRYWNHDSAVPVAAYAAEDISEEMLRERRQELDTQIAKARETYPYDFDWNADRLRAQLPELRTRLVAAAAEVAANPPGPDFTDDTPVNKSPVLAMIGRYSNAAEHEIIIQDPLFMVPDYRHSALLTLSRERNITLALHTNSLATSYGGLVHWPYTDVREDLLGVGMAIRELKPATPPHARYAAADRTTAQRSLHGKTTVIDRRYVYIGSFNMDLRSINLNTEVGLVINSPELAQQIHSDIAADMAPENSWRLFLNDDGDLRWSDDASGEVYAVDPLAGAHLHAGEVIGRLLPIEDLI